MLRHVAVTRIDDLPEYLASFAFDELRAFYRGIVCADQDLTRANATANMRAMYAFHREQWEENKREEFEALAREQEANRPDMYQAA